MRCFTNLAARIKHTLRGELTVEEMIELEETIRSGKENKKYDSVSSRYMQLAKKIPLSFLDSVIPQNTTMVSVEEPIVHSIAVQLDAGRCDVWERLDELFRIRRTGYFIRN